MPDVTDPSPQRNGREGRRDGRRLRKVPVGLIPVAPESFGMGGPAVGMQTVGPRDREVNLGSRDVRSQSGQPPPVRGDRERAQDRQEPDGVGLAGADRLPQGRRPAGPGALASAPGAATRPSADIPARRRARPAVFPVDPSPGTPSPRPDARPGGTSCTRPGSATRPRARSTRPSPCSPTARARPRSWPGGQSLVPLMKLRFASPELLVDINDLPGLDSPPRRRRRHDPHRCAVPARRPRALDAARRQPADHGRGRPAGRRPDRAHPGHPGRLAVPRRPSGRLGRRW